MKLLIQGKTKLLLDRQKRISAQMKLLIEYFPYDFLPNIELNNDEP